MITVQTTHLHEATGQTVAGEGQGRNVYAAWVEASNAAWANAGKPPTFGPGWRVTSFRVDGEEWHREVA